MKRFKWFFFVACLLAISTARVRAADQISSTTVRNAGGSFGGGYEFVFGNTSDGTGEAAAAKFTANTLSGGPTRLKITEIQWTCTGMNVGIVFDATTDSTATILSGQGWLKDISWIDPWTTGHTGNILFNTVGASAGDGYNIRIKAAPVQ